MAKESIGAIVEYRVCEGQNGAFENVINRKWQYQKNAGYIDSGPSLLSVNQRPQIYIEVFTWLGTDAIDRAHHDNQMTILWDELDACTEGGRWEGITITNGQWIYSQS
ncbi:MAG: hypothetical protein C7B46_16675 [Sulfobacillus benefaciens]|uniref:ABM domain-containing protein n=1 Tax=Sulfobacillus benefaciens TaxID=453960 RepID=A0A2T2XAQ5_9FIRM|nr:MAG: hypothetical protein C7B46_16675 [Sulfobacillus benefaciens]